MLTATQTPGVAVAEGESQMGKGSVRDTKKLRAFIIVMSGMDVGLRKRGKLLPPG